MRKPTQWEVVLFERPNGTSPVAEFIEEQSVSNQAKILAELDDLCEFGVEARGGKLKQLEGKLWELKFRGDSLQFRFIYFAFTGRKLVVLHGFCKKTGRTPTRELNIARQRYQVHLDRHSRQ